ncbi:hypothetical protein HELRODRAFT_86725, partial [Helobdella robusta]|uniref:Cytochrome c oxidase assembly factor 6 n=1 Tax=Helobdella robusta TaxID=6412 RepID=T1G6G2_HELRO
FLLLSTEMTAPNKQQREKCWHARDDYWKCLDENNEDVQPCLQFKKIFEQSCSNQWVSLVSFFSY